MYKKNPLLIQENCNKKKTSKKKEIKKSSEDKGTTYDILKKNNLI